MELSSEEAMEDSQPGSQLPEVSGTPCFVVMDSQMEEQQTTGGNSENGQEKSEEGRAQRLRGLQHLSKGSPGHLDPQVVSSIAKQAEREGLETGHVPEEGEGAPGSSEIEKSTDFVTKADDEDPVSSSQEDLFNPEEPMASKHDESVPSLSKDASSLLCTPSESLSCLRFSGIVLAQESSTSGSGSSINVVLPTPDAYGPPPICIPSTPSGPDTSNEELNDTAGQDDIVRDLPKTVLLKRKSTTTSEESEDAYGIPAWQQELNRQQKEKEALAGTQDSWLDESLRSHGQRSPPATVDSANPSSSLSEHVGKSSSESVESWSVPQQQPLMTSTGEESSKQSTATGSRPPSAVTVQKVDQTSERSQSLPIHGDGDRARARQAHESVKGGSDRKHSSLPDIGELETRQTTLDIIKKVGKAAAVESQSEDKSQRGSQTFKRSKEDELPVGSVPRQAHEEDDQDVDAKEASQPQGGDAAPSQDWFLRLSPSQTQTQTQHSQSRREPSSGAHDKDREPQFVRQGSPHDIRAEEGTGRESCTGITSTKVDKGESQRRTRISRQATPWHATPSDTKQSEEDVIVIPESEDAEVKVDEKRATTVDESKPGSDHRHGDSAPEGSQSGLCAHPEEREGDSVFVEGEEQWTGEGHSRLGQLGELDIGNSSSPMAGFHLSMPKDGALLRPRSMTPDLVGHQRPDRTPRHSTPIGDESEVTSVRTETTADPVQVTESEAKTSDKLVVSAVMDLDSVDNSEIPEFHLERPLIPTHVMKDVVLSPVKKPTSVFSRVQEAKKSSESGKKAAKQARKPTDSDPFSLPKSDSVLKRRKPEVSTSEAMEKRSIEKAGAPSSSSEDEEVGEDEDNLPPDQDVEDSATIPYTHAEEAQTEHGVEQENVEQRSERGDDDHDAAEEMSLDENGDDVLEEMDVSEGGVVEIDSGIDKEGSQQGRHQSLRSNQRRTNETGRTGQKDSDVRSGSSSTEERIISADVEQAGAASSADEMSILAQFIHSDSCSGADSAMQRQPKSQPKAPRKRSSESPRKHVTIADTEEVGPPKSAVVTGRRDPYEFTDSQSNKTPTPMKTWTRRDSDGQFESRPVRNVTRASAPALPAADDSTPRDVPRPDHGMAEPQSSSRTRPGKRKRPREAGTGEEGEEGEGEEGEGESSRPGATNQGRSPAAVIRRTPRRKKRSSEETRQQVTGQSPAGQPVPWKVIKVKQIITTQRVQEVIVRGELLERKVLSEKVEEVIEKMEQEFLTPSPQSKSSSLTSGSLADISSLGSRTSSSVGSMQKSVSITSVGAMQKSTSLSSISEGDNSSLVKTISLPGSEKGSPSVANVLPGGALTSPEADAKEAEFARPASTSSGRATPASPSVGATKRRRSPRARDTEEESVESEGIPCAQPRKDDGLSPGPDVDDNVASQADDLLPRAATTDSSNADTIILNSPPREQGEDEPPAQLSSDTAVAQLFMVPGVRVYTRWLDGFFYPGTILSEEKSNRLKVSFDDGDVRVVSAKDLLIKDWLSVGQSVMAESKDGYSYPGLVMGYYRTETGSDTGYVVETDSGETARYPRTKVILSKDQAAALMTSCTSSTGVSDISLENLVDGPRQRSRLRSVAGQGMVRTPSKLFTKTRSPRRAPSPVVTRSGGKRKLPPPKAADSGVSPKKRARQLLPTTSVVASPDLSKQGAQLRRSPRKRIPPASPKSATAGPSTSTCSLPSTPKTMEELMGPLPSNAALFRGMAFLLTQGEVVRRPRVMFDSSTSESEAEESQDETPFNKEYARRQIEAGGGVILRDFDKSQRTRYKIYLVANTYCRTKKYFLALAVSMPCISHLWIRDCCRIGKLQHYRAYLLPAGESVETGNVVEWRGQRCVLSGLNVFVVSQYDQVQSTWRSILIAAGCSLVTRFPTHNEVSRGGIPFDCDVVVTDPTCPRHILHRAQQLAVPVVSVEWVMQSLINGQRMSYGGHPKFAWDFKEKLSK